MTLSKLRTLFRQEADDSATPPLWTDPVLTEFANDAVMEAVRRSKLILDSDTAQICEVEYDDDPILTLDPRVIEIREAIVSGQSLPLNALYLDQMPAGWRSATTSTPRDYIRDWSTGKIRLHPPPAVAGTVLLSVYREPMEPMANPNDEPEIPARYHRSLVQWMLYRAYSKQDAETNDPQKAAKAAAQFTAEFGPRSSARNEVWAREQSAQFPNALA